MTFPTIPAAEVACVNRTQMIEVDRVMIEDLGIGLIQMMENAGRGLALVCGSILQLPTAKILILAGRGGNGGGAITAGRRLVAKGYDVTIYITSPAKKFSGVPSHQLNICRALGVPIIEELPDTPDGYDLLVDGIIGYSLNGTPRGPAAAAIEWIGTRKSAKCISLDVPAGFDSGSGQASSLSVAPDAVVTLAAPKQGQQAAYSKAELYLVDISVPHSVMEKIVDQPFNVTDDIVQLI